MPVKRKKPLNEPEKTQRKENWNEPHKKPRPLKESWTEPDKKPVTARSGGRGWPASKEQVDKIKRARAEREHEEHASASVRKRLAERESKPKIGLRAGEANRVQRLRTTERDRIELSQLKKELTTLNTAAVKRKLTLKEDLRRRDLIKMLEEMQ